MQEIITKRLRLEPLSVSHASKLFADMQDERIYTYIPQSKPVNIEKLEENYQRRVKGPPSSSDEKWLNWAVFEKSTLSYIGVIEVTILENEAKLAYTIFPNHWRKGFAKEACSEIIKIISNIYNINRIISEVDTRNEASIKLLESLGFNNIEEIKDADFFKGETSNEFLYSIDIIKILPLP